MLLTREHRQPHPFIISGCQRIFFQQHDLTAAGKLRQLNRYGFIKDMGKPLTPISRLERHFSKCYPDLFKGIDLGICEPQRQTGRCRSSGPCGNAS
jgi:hypothetical protein